MFRLCQQCRRIALDGFSRKYRQHFSHHLFAKHSFLLLLRFVSRLYVSYCDENLTPVKLYCVLQIGELAFVCFKRFALLSRVKRSDIVVGNLVLFFNSRSFWFHPVIHPLG